MSFLSPIFLWALLALLPVAAVYFLKVRPRRKSTSAYFLWEKIFSEKRASSLFHRLRDWLSLLILLLVFALLALALARPEFTVDERKDVLLLIDHSASMSALDGGETRLALALDAAKDIAIALDGTQRAAIASVAGDMKFRSHLSESPRELIDAVNSIEASNYPLAIESIRALSQDAHWSDDYRIMLISDGSFAGDLPENIELLKVGQPAENIGIVAADLERIPDGRLGFFYQVTSSYADKVTTDLLIKQYNSEAIVKIVPLEVTPGLNPPETFFLEQADSGKWVVEIDHQDDFAKDDRALLTVPPIQPVRVGVSAENRFFFETSIVAFQQGSGLLALVDDDAEITIHQGRVTDDADLSVVFTPEGDSQWWKSIGEPADSVAPRVILEDHPVLKHIDFTSVTFVGGREIEPIDGALVLVESEQGNPLIYRATKGGKTVLVVNLDPIASDFYFSAWFPILVQSAATHLAAREGSLAPVYRPGDTISIPGHRAGFTTTLSVEGEPAIDLAEAKFGPVERLSFFNFSNPSGEWSASSSLLNKAESFLDNKSVIASHESISRGQTPAYWLIVIAIVLLALESILYHRRKVG